MSFNDQSGLCHSSRLAQDQSINDNEQPLIDLNDKPTLLPSPVQLEILSNSYEQFAIHHCFHLIAQFNLFLICSVLSLVLVVGV
jgi:hypothetical protein